MIVAFVIFERNFPSMYHARFLDEEECKKEVARLNENAARHNRKVREHPATGRGSAFLNMEQEENRWSYNRMEFPQ